MGLDLRSALVAAGLCSLLAGPSAVRADDELPLSTDRPDQTDSTDTTPARHFQLETGWQRTRDEAGGERLELDAAFGTLLRYGWSERFELRLGWLGWLTARERDAAGGATASGTGDGSLGFKLRLLDAAGARPAVAVEARTSLPVGARNLSSRRTDPAVLLAVQHNLSPQVSLGWNAGLAWSSEENEAGVRQTLSSLLASASLGVAFNDRLSGFVELFGAGAGSAAGASALSADGGLLWLLGRHLQLDLYAGEGLDGAAPDTFFGCGVSLRLPA